jgi:hypothetical protein
MNQEEKAWECGKSCFLRSLFWPSLVSQHGAGVATASFTHTHTGRGCFSPGPTHTERGLY